MRVLGFVPARGGSKGVPRKNIRSLCGKPLLAYTAEAALAAKRIERVVLSTDDAEIADVGRGLGLDVPFLRPPSLALDDTPTLPVVIHALSMIEAEHGRFDAVCILQPTSPLREPSEIDECIDLLEANHADTVLSVLAVPTRYNPHWVYEPHADGSLRISTGEAIPIPRRQSLPPAYHRDGAIYVTRRDVIVRGNSLYGARVVGFVRDPRRSVDIDTPEDWSHAEVMIDAMIRSGALRRHPDGTHTHVGTASLSST